MTAMQLTTLYNVLQRTLRGYKINLVTTTHSLQRFLLSKDMERTNIDALNFYETMKKFCENQGNNFIKYRQKQREYIAIITNNTSKLNIVVSIDYDKKPELNNMHNMKIITAMIKDHFGSDHYPTSIRVSID